MATLTRPEIERHVSLQPPRVSRLKNGYLLKRQRGQKPGVDLRKLKFQERYVSLTQDSLQYFVTDQMKILKGYFSVDRIKINEKVPDATFHLLFCFQIGDEEEIMYFSAKTENERREWMEAIQIAASLKGNAMLNHYHSGAYGQVHQHEWSCCNATNRDTQGCQLATIQFSEGKLPHRQLSLQVKSNRNHAGLFHQIETGSPLQGYPVTGTRQQDRSPSPVFYDAKEAPESEDISLTNQFHATHTFPSSKVNLDNTTEVISQLNNEKDTSSTNAERKMTINAESSTCSPDRIIPASAACTNHEFQPKIPILMEGYILKRQRGRSPKANPTKLKFQQRYISLNKDSLQYYVDKTKGEKRGDYPVDRMRIIEKVADATFNKTFCLQIGDEKEMMYFSTKSEDDRKDWIEAFQIGGAASLKENTMLNHCHSGAYGQVHQQKWSCCNAANRDTQGCQRIFVWSTGKRLPHQTSSLRLKRRRSNKRFYRRAESFHGYLPFQRSPSPVFYDAKETPEDLSPTMANQSLATNNNMTSLLEKDSHASATAIEIRNATGTRMSDTRCFSTVDSCPAKTTVDSKRSTCIKSLELQRKTCSSSGEGKTNSRNQTEHVHSWTNAMIPLVSLAAIIFFALVTDWKDNVKNKKDFDSDGQVRNTETLIVRENYMKDCPEMTSADVFELSEIIATYGNWKEWCEHLKLDEVICNSIDQSREHDASKPLTLTKAYLNQVDTCWKYIIEVLCMKLHKPRSARDLALKHGITFSIICT